jgi:hypothetical protein
VLQLPLALGPDERVRERAPHTSSSACALHLLDGPGVPPVFATPELPLDPLSLSRQPRSSQINPEDVFLPQHSRSFLLFLG